MAELVVMALALWRFVRLASRRGLSVARERVASSSHTLELTRFSGHLTLTKEEVRDAEVEAPIPAGVPAADGRAGARRALAGGVVP